ncbi:MAG: translation initiation factor IF-2 [Bacteroidales bacterium]|nr:translation initiation factor IF-2 [Bacteroidales bacterium]
MDNNTGTKRLSKVAIELNVGVLTLIDFLNSEGMPVEGPNAKIGEDVYDVLLKEFHKDKSVKQESMKINFKHQEEEEKAPVEKEKTPEKEDKSDDLLITNLSVNSTIVEKKEEPKEEVEKPKEKEEVKIEVKEEVKEEVKAEIIEEPKEEDPKELKEVKVEEKVEEEKKVIEEEKEKDLTTKVETEQEKKEEEKPIEEEKKHTGPKIVGKIDLDAGKKKAAKEKEEREKALRDEALKEKEKEEIKAKEAKTTEKSVVKKDEKETLPIEEKVSNHIETKFEKLTGPKIIDKIDISGFDKKPTKQQKEADKKKKNRPRIKKKKEAPVDQNKKDNNQDRNSNNNNKTRGKRKKETRPEISEDDINRHIKETLAQLQGSSKSKGAKYRRMKRDAVQQLEQDRMEQAEKEKSILKLNEFITVSELASLMNVPATQVIASCMSLGLLVSLNQRLDAEAISIVAMEFGFEVEFTSIDDENELEEEDDNPEDLKPRSPVVTVMGHVDHGKTSLLDYIRNTNVIAGESGGITQHIGAYEVILEDGRSITFLDTPGHEAFTAMRARGAKITDLAIIVIAADDQVMPQTIEAINHAKAAEVPMVFAINKMDKPGANPDKIKEQLANMNLLVEDWGGKYQSQEISAKKGENIEKLLEKVLLEADLLELQANPDRMANGTVIEASLDKGRGYVSTVLIQNGTLRVGDIFLAGSYYGRVKAMFNERNQPVDEAGPSAPVLLLGLNGAPTAGDLIKVYEDERDAKDLATKRQQLIREQTLRTQKHITLDEIGRRIAIGEFKELNIIVKGDVVGSIEALSDSLQKLSTDNVQVNIIHKAVGGVNESDVLLATASNAIIIGFQVRPSLTARKLAEKEQIEIRTYSIIYDAINEIKSAIEGMLEPKLVEKVVANIEVRDVFDVSKVGTIAGSMVLDGKINRTHKVRIIRDGIILFTGDISSLKRFKDDVKEVISGQDCGIGIENFNDIKAGDIIETFIEVEEKRKL